jgi:hypothetical protein
MRYEEGRLGREGKGRQNSTHTEDRPWKIGTKTWCRHQTFHLYRQQQKTLLIVWLVGGKGVKGKVMECWCW